MPFGTISSRVMLNKACLQTVIEFVISQRLRVDHEIRPIDAVDAHGSHSLAHRLDESVMVPTQMETRIKAGNYTVDRRFTSIAAPRLHRDITPTGFIDENEWSWRLVRHQNVDTRQFLAGLRFFADEMPALVV